MHMQDRYFLLNGCGKSCRVTGFFCPPRGLCLPVSERVSLNHRVFGYSFLLQSGLKEANLTLRLYANRKKKNKTHQKTCQEIRVCIRF